MYFSTAASVITVNGTCATREWKVMESLTGIWAVTKGLRDQSVTEISHVKHPRLFLHWQSSLSKYLGQEGGAEIRFPGPLDTDCSILQLSCSPTHPDPGLSSVMAPSGRIPTPLSSHWLLCGFILGCRWVCLSEEIRLSCCKYCMISLESAWNVWDEYAAENFLHPSFFVEILLKASLNCRLIPITCMWRISPGCFESGWNSPERLLPVCQYNMAQQGVHHTWHASHVGKAFRKKVFFLSYRNTTRSDDHLVCASLSSVSLLF